MNHRTVLIVGTFAIAGGSALIATRVAGQNAPAAPSNVERAANTPSSSPAALTPITTRPAAALSITFPATLIPDETVELYAKASGYVARIGVDIGSLVRKGDVLVQLDVPELQDDLRQNLAVVAARRAKVEAMKAKAVQAKLAVESALAELNRVQAALKLTRITHERKAELYREKAIPQQEFDVADNQLAINEAELKIAQAKVEGARGESLATEADVKASEADTAVAEADEARLRTLIDYTTIRAPFDGVVTRRGVDHGAFVRSAAQGAGDALLTIDKVDRLRLVIDVPETHAARVKCGTQLSIRMRSNGDTPLIAPVTRTAVSLRSDTRTMRTEIDLDNRNGELMPGTYARVTLLAGPQ